MDRVVLHTLRSKAGLSRRNKPPSLAQHLSSVISCPTNACAAYLSGSLHIHKGQTSVTKHSLPCSRHLLHHSHTTCLSSNAYAQIKSRKTLAFLPLPQVFNRLSRSSPHYTRACLLPSQLSRARRCNRPLHSIPVLHQPAGLKPLQLPLLTRTNLLQPTSHRSQTSRMIHMPFSHPLTLFS